MTLARLLRARGIHGELVAESFTSGPHRFRQLEQVELFAPEGGSRRAAVEQAWENRGALVLKFAGIDSRTEAEQLQGWEVRIPLEQRPAPPDGEYYISDLTGCEVVSPAGERIGEVTGWLDHGAAGLLEVRGSGGEILVPFAKSICLQIDLANRRIVARLPEGLADLNRS